MRAFLIRHSVLRQLTGALVCVWISLTPPVALRASQSRQPASSPADRRAILNDAQALAMMIGNRGLQALATLEIARLREPDDPAAALELTRRVAGVLPDLPAGNTFGDIMKSAFDPRYILADLAMAAFSPSALENARTARLALYTTRKAELTLQLFDMLGRTDPAAALETAAKLEPLFRTIALEALLRVSPRDAAATLPSVRQLIQGDKGDITSTDLALLAEAVQPNDPELARAVLNEALAKVRKDTPIEVLNVCERRQSPARL